MKFSCKTMFNVSTYEGIRIRFLCICKTICKLIYIAKGALTSILIKEWCDISNLFLLKYNNPKCMYAGIFVFFNVTRFIGTYTLRRAALCIKKPCFFTEIAINNYTAYTYMHKILYYGALSHTHTMYYTI